MNYKIRLTTLFYTAIITAAISTPTAFAATSIDKVWTTVNETQIASRGERLIQPSAYLTARFDVARFNQQLSGANGTLTIPTPDGEYLTFRLQTAPVMHADLAKKFPQIRTWAGSALDGSGAWARVDHTPAGFHGMIRTERGTYFVDPYQTQRGQAVGEDYLIYYKKSLNKNDSHGFQCNIHQEPNNGQSSSVEKPSTDGAFRTPVGDELKTYRLAVAATAEYTAFHGGTVPNGLAAIVTAINRVTGIYETELAIRMELIANNDVLIFTNTNTDGYTNNNGFTMLGQNQNKLDTVIGAANYDIGHVFSTGGGGIAGLGVVCRNNNKARGVTGLNSPIGDPFYVDYVAHEIGHQFGGNHTFNGTANACAGGNRNGPTAYEPGSGSTIMAYAGICGSHNIANASSPYFHSASFGEITAYTTTGSGANCPVVTATGNSAPVVDAGNPRAVPANTPIRLAGSAVDPDGHTLSYRWEQYDLGPGGAPSAPLGNAPIFRSFGAVSEPVRLLPRLVDIVNDSQSLGELIPSYERSLSFRLTALDNQPLGGGVDFDFVSHSVLDTGSPFEVTSQNTIVVWAGDSEQTVTWNVAGTTAFPIACTNVDISVSSNGGLTFEHVVAASTANDGSESITVPDDPSNNGRVMVSCSNNIFFDINNASIILEPSPNPDFALSAAPDVLAVCAPDDAQTTIDVASLNSFSELVSLSVINEPPNTTVSFSNNPVIAGNSSVLTIGNVSGSTSGVYSVTVNGNSTTGDRATTFDLELATATAGAAALSSPADQAVAVVLMPTLVWEPAANASSYLVELASDAGFAEPIVSDTTTATSYDVQELLEEDGVYFWRVTADNACGSAVSSVAMFSTVESPITYCSSPAAVIPNNDAGGVADVLTIADVGSVIDIDVSLQVTHPFVGNLRAELINQNSGTSVEIINQPGSAIIPGGCPVGNVDAVLDDEASGDLTMACEFGGVAIGGNFAPVEPLSAFDGESYGGDWTLVVYDDDGGNATNGTLNEWCVTITSGPSMSIDTDEDGLADDADNCIEIANPNQVDADADGYGNACDADLNNDGVINFLDLAQFQPLFLSTDPMADFNADGVVNFLDLVVLTGSFLGVPGPSAFAP